MDSPNPALRQQMQVFYKALRDNDVDTLTTLHTNGLPLSWLQSFAENSLPEYAMRHNSPEAAWWLMSHNVMPEDWSSFTGSAWKSFLKSGWDMVNSKEGANLSMQAYADIVKSGLKVSGERLPDWLDGVVMPVVHQTVQDTMRQTTRVASALMGRLGSFLRKPQTAEDASPTDAPEQVEPVAVKPSPEAPSRPSARVAAPVASSPVSEEPEKPTKSPKSPKDTKATAKVSKNVSSPKPISAKAMKTAQSKKVAKAAPKPSVPKKKVT